MTREALLRPTGVLLKAARTQVLSRAGARRGQDLSRRWWKVEVEGSGDPA